MVCITFRLKARKVGLEPISKWGIQLHNALLQDILRMINEKKHYLLKKNYMNNFELVISVKIYLLLRVSDTIVHTYILLYCFN